MKAKSKYLVGLVLLGSALVLAPACSDDGGNDDTNGSAGAGGDGAGGDGGNAGEGGGGAGGDGGTGGDPQEDPFDKATEITVDDSEEPTTFTLVDVSTADYFKFTGKAGDRIVIATSAQRLDPSSDGDSNNIIDTVVTLFDGSKKQIARNDDGWPRLGRDAALFTVLPADGEYFFTVEDCNSAFGADMCAPEDGIDTLDYQVWVAHTDKLVAKETTATKDNNGLDTAIPVVYGAKSQGSYPVSLLDGIFTAESETHVFSFTPPADANVEAGQRMRAEFFVHGPESELGNGSDSKVKIYVTTAGGDIYASADQANHGNAHNPESGLLNVSVPVTGGETYYLFIENADGKAQSNGSFYFIQHAVGTWWYGPVEAEAETPASNDTAEDAEALSTPTGATEGTFFVDGNLTDGAADVDWFTVEAPAGTANAGIFCDVQRAGSGLRGFTAELYANDGGEPGSKVLAKTDAANKDFAVSGAATPGNYFVKLSAASVDASVAGDYYRCTIAFR